MDLGMYSRAVSAALEAVRLYPWNGVMRAQFLCEAFDRDVAHEALAMARLSDGTVRHWRALLATLPE